MRSKNQKSMRSSIIIAAVFASVLIYIAGVMSGLYAGKIAQKDTAQRLDALRDYITILDNTVKNEQLKDSFSQTLSDSKRCEFATISMSNLVEQLQGYWKRLPFRIEEYEQNNNQLSEQYLELKSQYTQASIQTWIAAKNTYERCNTTLIPILYLYSRNCTECINQGEELDIVQRHIANETMRAFVFTIDADSPEIILSSIKTYYNITSEPAVIVREKVFQGRVFPAHTIEQEIGRQK